MVCGRKKKFLVYSGIFYYFETISLKTIFFWYSNQNHQNYYLDLIQKFERFYLFLAPIINHFFFDAKFIYKNLFFNSEQIFKNIYIIPNFRVEYLRHEGCPGSKIEKTEFENWGMVRKYWSPSRMKVLTISFL